MNTQQVIGLNASWDAYIRHGWFLVPIPQGTKGPQTPGWNRKENCLTIGSNLPPNFGVGLAHAYSGTMALDIDQWALAKELLAKNGIDLDELYKALDAVIIDSGREGRGKLIYSMPFGITLPTKKITRLIDGVNTTILEFRCATAEGLTVQDVLPPSIHPLTMQPYRWGGNGHWSRPPMLPIAIYDMWEAMVKKESEKIIRVVGTANTSWDEVRSAIEFIDPDAPYDLWTHILASLQCAGEAIGQPDVALSIADEWSSKGKKYKGSQEVAYKMSTFKADGGITLGTLFHHAREGGWSKPLPDVSSMFKDITPKSMHQLKDSLRPRAPKIDLSLFPTILAQRVEEVAVSAGMDTVVPMFAALATICGAVDARTRLNLGNGYSVPPILWLMVIGKSGTKKTPGSAPFFNVLAELEDEDIPNFKRKSLDWEVRQKLFENAKKDYMNHFGNGDILTANTVAPDIPDLPPQPVPLRIMCSDITSQRLAKMCSEQSRGVLCQLDEMKTWIDKLTDSKSGEGRSTWVKGYEGGRESVDRLSSDSFVGKLNVAIYGNIQPEVLKQKLANMGADGAIQRFIPGIVDIHTPDYPANIPAMLTTEHKWNEFIRKIYALEHREYNLSSEAYTAFIKFQRWHHQATKDNHLLGEADIFCESFSKLEGTLGRLCLILHLCDDPYSPVVKGETMQRAVDIMNGFIIPSFKYTFGEVVGLFEASLEYWTMQHVMQISGEIQTITLADIKRSAKRKLEKLTTWQAETEIGFAMDYLEQHGWVAEIEASRRDSRIWAINPSLAKDYADDYKALAMAKQRKLDAIWQTVKLKSPDIPRTIAKGYSVEWDNEL